MQSKQVKHRAHTVHILSQTGKIFSVEKDYGRHALPPGKRMSGSGKTYWETRKNRSDVVGKRL